MNAAFHWFSYAPDSALLTHSVASVRRVFSAATLHIWEQDDNPIEEPWRGWLLRAGVSLQATTWPRHGNLNGMEAISGVLSCLASSSAEWSVKMDSDTLLLGRNRVPVMFAGDAFFPMHQGDPYGFFYALRTSAIPSIQSPSKSALNALAPRYPEDRSIWTLAKVSGLDVREWPLGAPRWTGWHPGKGIAALRGYDVVTLGNLPVGASKQQARDAVLAVMQTIVPISP